MYNLPTYIEMEGVQYRITDNGDYRMVLGIFSILDDPDLTKEERILTALLVFYADCESLVDVYSLPNLELAVQEMFKFFNAGQKESKHTLKLLDWQDDEFMIMPAVNKAAGKELRIEEYVHWWTFLGYYMSVGESLLSTVLSIRDKIMKGKSLEKWERKYQMENPQYFQWRRKTADEIEAENWVMSMWNGEG